VDSFRALDGTLRLALDGAEYFSSPAIPCEAGSARPHANGKVTHVHSALTPVRVQPGGDKGVPLAPEFVTPQDGAARPDCALAAAQRWLAAHGARGWPAARRPSSATTGTAMNRSVATGWPWGMTSSWSASPPPTPPSTHGWSIWRATARLAPPCVPAGLASAARPTPTATPARSPCATRTLRSGSTGASLVTTDDSGQVRYRNAFATRLAVDAGNVAEVVAAGRSRWKIENENNNTLKTKGYHFEYNFGHGQQHRSALLASLITLAFLTHTVLEWMDDKHQLLLRKQLPSRQRLFNDLRTLTSYLCFQSWEALMDFMLDSFKPSPAQPETG